MRAWNSTQGTTAIKVADRSDVHAIYKGLALADTPAGPRLFAADFRNQRIDVFDSTFTLVPNSGFVDPALPKRFSPFDVQVIGNRVFVAYAKLDDNGVDELAGPGRGRVDVYDLAATWSAGSSTAPVQLNAPWGWRSRRRASRTSRRPARGELRRRADQRLPRDLAGQFVHDGKLRGPTTGARDRRALGAAVRPGRRQHAGGTLFFTAGPADSRTGSSAS